MAVAPDPNSCQLITNWNAQQFQQLAGGCDRDCTSGASRVKFNIGENKYRLVAHVSYLTKRVPIKFIGTHREYDRIDPERV
jgi:mRNA-degrading endonuclease HigB of HigAB toxin-antitoxin module